jgi:SAM-dependent methyltransferase
MEQKHNAFREHLSKIVLIVRTGAPLPVLFVFCKRLLLKLLGVLSGERLARNTLLMVPIDESGTFTTKWFDLHAKEWMTILNAERLSERPLEILEIGSWEGRSTSFFLHYLRGSHVTAVDTWQGSDEHSGYIQLREIEDRFDSNVARFDGRLTKVKSTSRAYFAAEAPQQRFDIIYVDGGHHADDVMIDALEAFAALKPGGILVFDDYTWEFYKVMRHNPAFSINCFLKMKRGEYTILSVTAQLYIKKRDSVRPRA